MGIIFKRDKEGVKIQNTYEKISLLYIHLGR